MTPADAFLQALKAEAIDVFVGVPCSMAGGLIERLLIDPAFSYLNSTNEGEAVAISAGAWLAGRRSVTFLQNSGLGNAVSPLASLCAPFGIPSLLLVTHRGAPGSADEPQHRLMGNITRDVLSLLEIGIENVPRELPDIAATVQRVAYEQCVSGRSAAFLLNYSFSAKDRLQVPAPSTYSFNPVRRYRDDQSPPRRIDALAAILEELPKSTAIIASTGKTSRELFEIEDRHQHFYMVGSMGCASAVGLGVAISVPSKQTRVAVIDGDGAALMRLETLSTIGYVSPSNLVHFVLDNGTHDSTGGQPTTSCSTDLAGVAQHCGYRFIASCSSVSTLRQAISESGRERGPAFIHVSIRPGSKEGLGRPTVSPVEVASRFKAFLTDPLSEPLNEYRAGNHEISAVRASSARNADTEASVSQKVGSHCGAGAVRLGHVMRDLTAVLEEQIERGQLSGAVLLGALSGNVVACRRFGAVLDKPTIPVTEDTIFPAYSMTKLATTLVVLKLCERQAIRLDAPISEYLPEFADVKVLGFSGERMQSSSAITVRNLLLHNSGIDGSGYGRPELTNLYQEAGVRPHEPDGVPIFASSSDFRARLAGLPLAFHPGTYWRYGLSHDLLGCLLEAVTGSGLNQLFAAELYSELGLKHSGFERDTGSVAIPDGRQEQPFRSAGSGLFTTASDYHRLCVQLVMAKDRERVPAILDGGIRKLFCEDHLAHPIGADPSGFPGHEWGFGYGIGVKRSRTQIQLGWLSRGGSCFVVDPMSGEILIMMLQNTAIPNRFYFGVLRQAFDRRLDVDC